MSLRSLVVRSLVFAGLAAPAWGQAAAPPEPPTASAALDDAPTLPLDLEPAPDSAQEPADPFDGLKPAPPTRPQTPAATPQAAVPVADLPPEAPRDEHVRRVQVPQQPRFQAAAPDSPEVLRAAAQAPTPPLQSTPADLTPGDPTLLPAERLTAGPTTAGLTVEVRAPEVANLNLDNAFLIIVRNNGPSDAAGVLVRYPLLADLDFVDAEPAPTRADAGVYSWVLNTLPVGSEKTIKVKVRPRAKKTYDHAVTVSLLTGGRARTIVRQPQLKVELRGDKAKPLKGVPVVFDIVVTNVGDHPARDVTVQARLSPGFTHPRGTDLVLPLKDELGIASIAPGDSVPLKLEVETTGMGLQTCDVIATSPDQPEEATAHAEVEVVHPDLALTIEGPAERYPDNVATYKITVTNNGSAAARQVVVAAQVPTGARPEAVNPRATWAKDVRTFYWRLNELPPKATEVFTVQARMGGVGMLNLIAGAKAEGITPIKRSHTTEIRGISKLSLVVNEPRGVLDEGEESTYEIRIRNDGTKDATRVQVRAQLSDNLQILSVTGADARAPNPAPADPTTAIFPLVERLPQGGEVTMSFRVRAVKPGNGTCEVSVLDDEIQTAIRQSMITRVTRAGGPAN
jgi:uncharacterized repeat protein (TIGR01451 family)